MLKSDFFYICSKSILIIGGFVEGSVGMWNLIDLEIKAELCVIRSMVFLIISKYYFKSSVIHI